MSDNAFPLVLALVGGSLIIGAVVGTASSIEKDMKCRDFTTRTEYADRLARNCKQLNGPDCEWINIEAQLVIGQELQCVKGEE